MSNYNALWVTATKSAGHGIEFNMTYDFSKSLDTNSLGSQGGYTFQDSNNPANNYGPSDFDTRHHYSATAIYSLPSRGNRLVDGFRISTIVQYQTGNPVNLTYNTSTYTGVAGLIRPNLVGPIATSKVQTGSTNVQFIQSAVCPVTVSTTPAAGCSFQNPAYLVPAPTATNRGGDADGVYRAGQHVAEQGLRAGVCGCGHFGREGHERSPSGCCSSCVRMRSTS